MATIRQKPETYAITIVTFRRQRLFQSTRNAALMIATLCRYRNLGHFALHGFVIMPDHLHILVTPDIDRSTSRCLQLIKGGFSFAIRAHYPGEIWHTGYHEHRIRDLAAQLSYIADNPIRKHLSVYPHVHTCHPNLLDPVPNHLATCSS